MRLSNVAPPTYLSSALYLDHTICAALALMAMIYVKGKGEGAPRTEVAVDRVEGMAVEDFLDAVAQKMNIKKNELRKCACCSLRQKHRRVLPYSQV